VNCMDLQELEIIIGENGETRIRVRGVRGPECKEVTRELEEQLGDLQEQQFTGEYYETCREKERERLKREKTGERK